MKKIFTFLYLLCFVSIIEAQSSFEILNSQDEIITGNTIVIPINIGGETSFDIKIKNINSSQVTAKIYKSYLEGPVEGSYDWMCSPETQSTQGGSCVTGIQTPSFVLLANEISSPAQMHYEAGTNAGVTTISYRVVNIDNENDFQEVILSFSTEGNSVGQQIIDFGIYPNPASNVFYISSGNLKNYKIEVYNVLGKIIYKSENLTYSKTKVNCSNWENGYYFIRIFSDTKLEKTLKITVNK